VAAAAGLLALTGVAAAQDYPARPVRVVVPFPPGAINDTVGRLLAQALSERLGKQFVVENRAGAGSVVGNEFVANAPKDGYTLLIVSLATAVAPALYKLPYDPVHSFAPVAMVLSAPNVVVVNPSVPVHSLKELIELAKSKPGDIQYGSGGVGSFMHLGGEMFKLAAGVDLLHVPYKGGGPAFISLIGGHVSAIFATSVTAPPHIRAGKVRALAVGARNRLPLLPDVPTAAEAGLPNYDVANWIGVVAPAGTPEPIIAKLHAAITAIQDSPEMQKRIVADGAEIVKMGTAEFGAFIQSEMDKWSKVIKAGNIKPQ
jgi:tripartite-type tricarboxylate transporter receptor subunit TctC